MAAAEAAARLLWPACLTLLSVKTLQHPALLLLLLHT
jgi:hypothetical protein